MCRIGLSNIEAIEQKRANDRLYKALYELTNGPFCSKGRSFSDDDAIYYKCPEKGLYIKVVQGYINYMSNTDEKILASQVWALPSTGWNECLLRAYSRTPPLDAYDIDHYQYLCMVSSPLPLRQITDFPYIDAYRGYNPSICVVKQYPNKELKKIGINLSTTLDRYDVDDYEEHIPLTYTKFNHIIDANLRRILTIFDVVYDVLFANNYHWIEYEEK